MSAMPSEVACGDCNSVKEASLAEFVERDFGIQVMDVMISMLPVNQTHQWMHAHVAR